MNLLLFPVDHPCFYGVMALIISVFYGIQGILIKSHEVHNENIESKKDGKKEWSTWERCLIHYPEYFLFNFICGIAGFIALFVEIKIFMNIKDFTKIGTGTAALLVFLSLVSILGTAGKLSFVFYHGKIFGSKA